MSVTSVTEIYKGRGSSEDDKSERTYKRVFRVVTDSFMDGPAIVRVATAGGKSIPFRYEPYVILGPDGSIVEQDEECLCRKKDVAPEDDEPNVWIVTCTYSNRIETPADPPGADADNKTPEEKQESKQPQEPTERPAQFRWSKSTVERVIERSVATDGVESKAIRSSSWERFDPPVTIDETILHLSIEQNEYLFDPNVNADAGKINKGSFFGFAEGKVKFDGATGERQYEEKKFFWKVTYEFSIKTNGVWSPVEILDQGYMMLTMIDGQQKQVPYRDPQTGQPINGPGLLNGNGIPAPGHSPQYLTFHTLEKISFAKFPLRIF